MKNQEVIKELMLDIYQVGKTITVWNCISNLFSAVKNEAIPNEQLDLLCDVLLEHCKRENIDTEINIG